MSDATPTDHPNAAGSRILRSYRLRAYRDEEVEAICHMGESSLGVGHHPRAVVLRDRLKACPEALTVIERFAPPDVRTAGYLIIYRLNEEACRRVLQGELANGSGLVPGDLCENRSDASGLYIGMIYGTGRWPDRGAAVFFARSAIDTAFQESFSLRHVFARAGTEFGERLLHRFGGVRVNARQSEIWQLERP